jgi:nitroimidazol reductase NimA-like FMN-containing flavoprotein (pyridoxamine 5'-phosphate oxidase superfamily)
LEREEETWKSIRGLLVSQRFAVLSTESETGPYSSLIAFWAAEDLGHIVFATLRATRKFNYLVTHPRVALLFDDRSNSDLDVRGAIAVTATGTARELTDHSDRVHASVELLAKHPQLALFVASPGCTLVRVDVDTYYAVAHFQDVVELHVPGQGHVG